MKRLALTALAVWVAGPALAGGLADPVVEPVVTVAPTPVATDGDWSGFYLGAQIGYADVGTDTVDADGGLGGVQAGYRWDFGRTVLGAELDVNGSDVQSDDGVAELDTLTRFKLSAGADLGRALVYGTLGAAKADATIGGTEFGDTGWLAGVGVEYALTESWLVGGEILHHQFDDFDDQGIDVDATTVALRASYRF